MRNDLASALRRALKNTRASDPRGATAIIQEALGGGADRADCGPCNAFRDAMNGVRGPRAEARSQSSWGGLSGLSRMGDLSGLSGFGGGSAKPGKRAPVPEGAQVEMLRHESAAGSRDYRLFVPSPREGEPVGLVLMLHGCTQSPEDFALGTRMDLAAEAAGFVVAYPGQTGAHNMQSCWNWFRPEDQTRDRGEPAMLASLATTLAERFDLAGRAHVAGLSAGGAMAAVLAETHPDIFTAAGIHSGLPAGAAQDIPSAFAAMQGQAGGRAPKIPVIVFHGTADNTVSVRNARALIPGSGVETTHAADGRSWTRLTTEGSELWLVEGAGHAWFGGDPAGSYADAAGPDASAEMLRFFGEQARG